MCRGNVWRLGLYTLLMFTFAFVPSSGQQLAFPGAEGGGQYSTGGRGGTVYEVTNLNDSGPGSLRDAVSQSNRTIVFRVSGVIHLNSKLTISRNNLTIAGQTAPGDGICISGYTVNLKASNVIIRYLRFRLSDINNIEDDAMNSFSGAYENNIIDHCSLSWSVDETGSFYDIKNFTLQWCILSESLYHSVHGKGNHGYAGIWGGNKASFHHNLLAHHTSRNPRFGGSRYTGKPEEEIVDFRNNVIYNWGSGNSAYGGEGGHYNIVNNYYKAGPATPGNLTTSSTSNKRNRILNYTSYYYSSDAAVYPDTVWGGKFFIEGNYVDGYPDVTADNWTRGVQKDSYAKAAQLIAAARQSNPFATPPITTHTAEEAYALVLDHVGASFPVRDAIDERIINEVSTGTATFEGETYAAVTSTGVSHPSGIIDTQSDVGGLPDYNSVTPPADSDHDGMPDDWELAMGLNPDSAPDRNGIGMDGYTYLELYLNDLVEEKPSTGSILINKSLDPFEQTESEPSVIETYGVGGLHLTSDLVITPPAPFEISSDGVNWVEAPGSIALAPDGSGFLPSTTVYVRMNAADLGTFFGNVVHACASGLSKNLFVEGENAAITSSESGASSGFRVRNPVRNWLVIQNDHPHADTQYNLVDLNGRRLLSVGAAPVETVIDVREQPSGMYILECKSEVRTQRYRVILL